MELLKDLGQYLLSFILGIGFIIVVVAQLGKKFLGSSNREESIFGEYASYLYKKDYLMTKRENEFFKNLCEYIKDKDYLVCPKVRLEDVVGVRTTRKGFRPWKVSSRLDRAHIDFLLIGKTDYISKFAIELDDTTHDNKYGRIHDKVKDEACSRVGIPLKRFRNSNATAEEFALAGI